MKTILEEEKNQVNRIDILIKSKANRIWINKRWIAVIKSYRKKFMQNRDSLDVYAKMAGRIRSSGYVYATANITALKLER